MELENKKILITGGAGFVGSHLCERLLKEGSEVVILDNFSTGNLSNLDKIKDKIKIIEGDIKNYEDVLRSIEGCEIVIHEAFPYGKSGMGLEQQYIEEGILGTFNLLKASVKKGIKKFVNISSVSAYGIQEKTPLKEEDKINAFLPYGVTKYSGELYCKSFSKIYGLETISLRYLFGYGPRYAQFDHNAIVNFMNNVVKNKPLIIYGDGLQTRDYSYIDDLVEGTILAAKKDKSSGEVYNISSGEGINILDLAKKIIEISGKNLEIKFAEPGEYKFGDEFCKIPIGATTKENEKWVDKRNYVGDISKAKSELGYNPKIDLEEGIKKTLEWLEKQNE
jgi:nucleoside-diphosphate-sugar epimerase